MGGERLDVGDRLPERVATPGGQRAVEGAGQLVEQVRRRDQRRFPFAAALGEVLVVDARRMRRQPGCYYPSALIAHHGGRPLSSFAGRKVILRGGRTTVVGGAEDNEPVPRDVLLYPTRGLGARPRSELGEEPRVVLIEQTNIVDPVASHAEPFDAQP